MNGMFQELSSLTPELAARLAALVRPVRPPSIVAPSPTARSLLEQATNAQKFVVVRDATGEPTGWGTLQSWPEAGLRMYLIDGFVRLSARNAGIATAMLQRLERAAAAAVELGPVGQRAMIGANADADQPDRQKLLTDNGYEVALMVSELQIVRASELAPVPLPAALTIRTAGPDDASTLHRMMQRVWSGRPFFQEPTRESYRRWLSSADLDLFQVAEVSGTVAGYVASKRLTNTLAEIEDVLVDLPFHRRGIASHLIRHNLSVLAGRGDPEVRLQTEGHDPAGALSLYRQLGFSVAHEHLRYRKALTSQTSSAAGRGPRDGVSPAVAP